jgi:Tfp pilus assembly PilM family ATPase
MMRRHEAPIGIDLGSAALGAVQLGPRGRSVEAAIELPRRGDGLDLNGEIARLVRVMARQGFRDGPVIVGLPDHDVTVAELTLPTASSGAPLDDIVAAQLARICQADPSTLECGWWATDATSATATTRSLAAAVPWSVADSIAEAFDRAGLEVAAMEARPLAIARACRMIAQPGLEVVIDRSAPLPIMIVLERQEVSYVRPFTRPAARTGIDETPQALSVEAFLAELRLTLGYLSHRHPTESVARILLAGTERDLLPISETLTYTWDLPGEMLRLDGLAQLPERLGCGGPGLVPALGLALRGRAA